MKCECNEGFHWCRLHDGLEATFFGAIKWILVVTIVMIFSGSVLSVFATDFLQRLPSWCEMYDK